MTHIFQYIILGFYLWSVLSICSTLLTLQINMTDMSGKTVAMIPSAIGLFWSLALFYSFCQFGQRLTDHFSELEMAISECDWYLFPEETQRILPIIIVAYQRHVTLQGFGNVSCTRETFKQVIYKTFDFWLVEDSHRNFSLNFSWSMEHFHILRCFDKQYVEISLILINLSSLFYLSLFLG